MKPASIRMVVDFRRRSGRGNPAPRRIVRERHVVHRGEGAKALGQSLDFDQSRLVRCVCDASRHPFVPLKSSLSAEIQELRVNATGTGDCDGRLTRRRAGRQIGAVPRSMEMPRAVVLARRGPEHSDDAVPVTPVTMKG